VVSEAPSTTSSPARRIESVMSASAISALSCQPWASWMLRWYCLVASIEVRSAIARETLYGSSDGRVSSLLEETFCWILFSRSLTRLRSDRMLRCVIPVVMRVLIYRPTLPVRLMRTSSISSIVDMAREDAW
jgi:hypothetical protein